MITLVLTIFFAGLSACLFIALLSVKDQVKELSDRIRIDRCVESMIFESSRNHVHGPNTL